MLLHPVSKVPKTSSYEQLFHNGIQSSTRNAISATAIFQETSLEQQCVHEKKSTQGNLLIYIQESVYLHQNMSPTLIILPKNTTANRLPEKKDFVEKDSRFLSVCCFRNHVEA